VGWSDWIDSVEELSDASVSMASASAGYSTYGQTATYPPDPAMAALSTEAVQPILDSAMATGDFSAAGVSVGWGPYYDLGLGSGFQIWRYWTGGAGLGDTTAFLTDTQIVSGRRVLVDCSAEMPHYRNSSDPDWGFDDEGTPRVETIEFESGSGVMLGFVDWVAQMTCAASQNYNIQTFGDPGSSTALITGDTSVPNVSVYSKAGNGIAPGLAPSAVPGFLANDSWPQAADGTLLTVFEDLPALSDPSEITRNIPLAAMGSSEFTLILVPDLTPRASGEVHQPGIDDLGPSFNIQNWRIDAGWFLRINNGPQFRILPPRYRLWSSGTPPLRQVQRDDGLGRSVVRARSTHSVQFSLRQRGYR
jgi:hypothetical protein